MTVTLHRSRGTCCGREARLLTAGVLACGAVLLPAGTAFAQDMPAMSNGMLCPHAVGDASNPATAVPPTRSTTNEAPLGARPASATQSPGRPASKPASKAPAERAAATTPASAPATTAARNTAGAGAAAPAVHKQRAVVPVAQPQRVAVPVAQSQRATAPSRAVAASRRHAAPATVGGAEAHGTRSAREHSDSHRAGDPRCDAPGCRERTAGHLDGDRHRAGLRHVAGDRRRAHPHRVCSGHRGPAATWQRWRSGPRRCERSARAVTPPARAD